MVTCPLWISTAVDDEFVDYGVELFESRSLFVTIFRQLENISDDTPGEGRLSVFYPVIYIYLDHNAHLRSYNLVY